MSIVSAQFIMFLALLWGLCRWRPVWRWQFLLAASLLFYLSLDRLGFGFLLLTALTVWLCARQIGRVYRDEKEWLAQNKKALTKAEREPFRAGFAAARGRWLWAGLLIDLGALFLLKYLGLFRLSWAEPATILVPLGISYYSLQAASYLIDVHRGLQEPEKNPLLVLLFVAFFPAITQGPFNRFGQLMPQLTARRAPTTAQLARGAQRMLWGYLQKMVIADQAAVLVNAVWSGYEQMTGWELLLGLFSYGLQLYADFNGYTNIMLGLGETLGITLPDNFRQPFFSRNMSEFWQRWHITLGAWLKDYVFYPVLRCAPMAALTKACEARWGKKTGRSIATYTGLFILWFTIGLWHGAGFNFVFGVGILQFLYIFLGELCAPQLEKLNRALRVERFPRVWRVWQGLRCTLLMCFAWVFFRSPNFGAALRYLAGLARLGGGWAAVQAHCGEQALLGMTARVLAVRVAFLVACAAVLLAVDLLHEKGISIRHRLDGMPFAARQGLILAAVFALLVFGSYGTPYASGSFEYFKF